LIKTESLSLSVESETADDQNRTGELLVGNIDSVKSLDIFHSGGGYIGVTAASAPALENVAYGSSPSSSEETATAFLIPGSSLNTISAAVGHFFSSRKVQIYLGESGVRPAQNLSIIWQNALAMVDACQAPVDNVTIEGSVGKLIVAPKVNVTVLESTNRTMPL